MTLTIIVRSYARPEHAGISRRNERSVSWPASCGERRARVPFVGDDNDFTVLHEDPSRSSCFNVVLFARFHLAMVAIDRRFDDEADRTASNRAEEDFIGVIEELFRSVIFIPRVSSRFTIYCWSDKEMKRCWKVRFKCIWLHHSTPMVKENYSEP